MHLTANNLLLIISNTILASGYVVERGYTLSTEIKYCQEMVSQLNARYKANILPEKCADILEIINASTKSVNPTGLQCHELVARVKERGIQTDAGICSTDVVNGQSLEDIVRKYEGHCNELIERLKPFHARIDPLVCSKITTNQKPKDVLNNIINDANISNLTCHDLVKLAQKMGLKLSSSICRGVVVGISDNQNPFLNRKLGLLEKEDGDSVCPNIASRLHDLGYKADMKACLDIKIVSGPSREVINKMTCDEIVAHAKALRILKNETNICQRNSLASNSIRKPERTKYSECQVINTRLRVFGIDVDDVVCSTLKIDSGLTKDDIDTMECQDIVAHAQAIHIIKSDINACHNKILD
ncbi:hypothetical protein K7432_011420 [Basidiobolus ranarum]|uniref:Uncharacterized protein n=1 Tax=Basidiobolus ranarum TaxID=34480 RepID=A0ABR2WMA8_9FUNG